MVILEKNEISRRLYSYYKECCGVQDTDVWLESPAINVWSFVRAGEVITLKFDLKRGTVNCV